jgi:hypothetical protein
MSEQLAQSTLVVAAILLVFGIWEVIKILRAIQTDIRQMRLMQFGTNKPEGWEE